MMPSPRCLIVHSTRTPSCVPGIDLHSSSISGPTSGAAVVDASAYPGFGNTEELLHVRDVVELLRDFLRSKALTESEIRREVRMLDRCDSASLARGGAATSALLIALNCCNGAECCKARSFLFLFASRPEVQSINACVHLCLLSRLGLWSVVFPHNLVYLWMVFLVTTQSLPASMFLEGDRHSPSGSGLLGRLYLNDDHPKSCSSTESRTASAASGNGKASCRSSVALDPSARRSIRCSWHDACWN